MQQLLILYLLETVPVPTVDKNIEADSYTQLQIKKTIFNFKYRNLYKYQIAGGSNM